jgi:hypothetical protein
MPASHPPEFRRRAVELARENDAESINLPGYALMVNGLALHRHRRRRPTTPAA